MNFDSTASIGDHMRINDAAKALGVSHQSVRNLIFRGDLSPAFRVGSLILIPKTSIETYLKRAVIQPSAHAQAA
jgi:excisionase family DNA binding protein